MSVLKHIKKEKKRESTLHKTSNYAKNCNTGFRTKPYCEIHHIVCLQSVAARVEQYNPGLKDYVEACLWVTPWDINDSNNLMGLPLNFQYRMSDGTAPKNMPSHQVDHNTRGGYREEVSDYLKENVWNALTAKKKVHDVDVKRLKDELDKASTTFRGRIKVRGTRQGGTKKCWQKRFDKAYKALWYHPFSMALRPNPRHPGLSLKTLVKIFKKLN
ncbi:AHH domain-containing protein [Pyxidicoccus xibeiensis]|uniref:AHH domain-containing protein n=1 Tax=Pyxidicoccus xibeiensis TaxID=2906759 RepID=UPI0020A824AB|nr:AHH domain-containing protein [Pyxidicoccus xibeiensis]MCP3143936.1 AHH domain-containing protein [Pyxidicoccus xibeiensis]